MGQTFNWHHELQYRNYSLTGDLEQLLIRTGIGYNLNHENNVLLGYGYILSQNYVPGSEGKETVPEHRIFQQYIGKQSINRIQIQHRLRFEQRFLQDDFRLRFRYFLGLNIGINRPQLTSKTAYFSFYNEVFLNTSSKPFDRNRLYVGLGYKFNDFARLEFGYMNQFFSVSGRDQLNISAFFNW